MFPGIKVTSYFGPSSAIRVKAFNLRKEEHRFT